MLERDKALAQLLAGTPLAVMKDASGAVLIVRRAGAQTEAEPTATSQLAQVIVTGTLRRTELQKTALSISALSESTLKDMGAEAMSDFYRKVPGLSIMDRGPNDKKLVLRGIQNDVATGNNTVGVYIDDIPVSLAGAQLDMNLFDVARVEVLRGPQGTLYGASSMTGTIKYITNRPDVRMFESTVQAGLAATRNGGNSHSAEAMVNVPLSEGQTALRVVGYKRHNAGYIDRVYPGQVVPAFAGTPADAFFPGSPPVRGHDAYTLAPITQKAANGHDVTGGRAALQYKPNGALVLTGTAMHEDSKVEDKFAHQPELYGDLRNGVTIRMPSHHQNSLYNLTAEYDLGPVALYASANHLRNDVAVNEQFTGVFPAELTPTGTELITRSSNRASTGELRLRSNQPGRLGWLAGLWSFHAKGSTTQIIQVQQGQQLRVVDETTPSHDRQWALFGELSYELLPKLTGTLGLRHWNIAQSFGPKTVDVEPAIFFLPPKAWTRW